MQAAAVLVEEGKARRKGRGDFAPWGKGEFLCSGIALV